MSSSSSNFITPEGQYPPFAVTDHSAWIIIATSLGLSLVLLFAIIREVVRCVFSDGFGLDDGFLCGSTLLTIVQSSIILSACSQGLGKSIELIAEENVDRLQQKVYSSRLLFITALGLSKVSVALFLHRLTPVLRQRAVFLWGGGVIALWTVLSLFDVAFQCNMKHPWLLLGQDCSGAFARWCAIGAFDILTEIGLVAMAVYLVWDLSTSWRKKGVVLFAFAFRLLLSIAIAYRIVTFDPAGLTTNPFLQEDEFIVWTQTEMCYSVISSTIPTLRPFVKDLSTHYGGSGEKTGNSNNSRYGSGNRYNRTAGGSGFQMAILKPKTRSQSRDEEIDAGGMEGVWEPVDYKYGIAGNSSSASKQTDLDKSDKCNPDATSIGSHESQRRMIIRKDVS